MARTGRSTIALMSQPARSFWQTQQALPPEALPLFGPLLDQHKNLFLTNVVVAPQAPGFNTITVATGTGANLPQPPFDFTTWPQNTAATFLNAEICRCVAVNGDTLLFSRAVEFPFIAVGISTGYQIAVAHTVKDQVDVEKLFARAMTFDVRDNYGGGYAVLDNATNDWGPIQAAVDKAGQAVKDGVPSALVLIPGRASIVNTLIVNQSGVSLVGHGSGYTSDIGSYINSASGLRWNGVAGGTMVQVTPISGATAQAIKAFRFVGLMLDGAFGNAGIMLQLLSCQGARIEDFFFTGSTVAGLDMSTVALAQVGEAEDCARNLIQRGCIRQVDGSGVGIGIRCNGNTTANTNLNTYSLIEIVHSTGKAIQLLNADSNLFSNIVINRAAGGTGIGIEENGSNVSAALASRNNYYVSGTAGLGGLTMRGTGLTFPAGPSYWPAYQQGNGEPAPTVETGAILFWSPNGGFAIGPVNTPAVGAPAALTTPAAVIPGSQVITAPQAVQAGTTLEWTVDGLQTTTALAQGSPFVLRFGTTGTAADAAVATMPFSSLAATAATALPFTLRCKIVVRTGGAAATSYVIWEVLQTGTAAAPGTAAGMCATAFSYRAQIAGTAFNGNLGASGQAFFSLSYIGAAAQSITPELVVCNCLKPANP